MERGAAGSMPDFDTARDYIKFLRILHHATMAFLSRGFEGASLDEIAMSAGVGKVTIYRYFRDKDDLFVQCVLAAVKDITSHDRPIALTGRSAEDILIDCAAQHIQRMMRPVAGPHRFYDVARLLVSTSFKHPRLVRDCKALFWNTIHRPLVTYFEAMVTNGQVSGDPGVLAEYFQQGLFFTNSVILDPGCAEDAPGILANATVKVRIFLNGCKAGPGAIDERRADSAMVPGGPVPG